MFRKIVSNLPFSPALVGQLGVYSKRLNKEEKIRRIGLIFLILAFGIQLMTIIYPSESANSSNFATTLPTLTLDTDISNTITASNLSQGFIDASSKIAEASDQISYTITVRNNGNSKTQTDIALPIADLLDYATVLDSGGGKIDKTSGMISWPTTTLSPSTSQTRTFVIKLLDSIPATAKGVNNKQSFDCKLSTTYGNSININVDCPSQKIVEQITSELPSTNATSSVSFSLLIIFIAAYLYARTCQLKKEVRMIRKDSTTGTV